jgi:hypothetical protein
VVCVVAPHVLPVCCACVLRRGTFWASNRATLAAGCLQMSRHVLAYWRDSPAFLQHACLQAAVAAGAAAAEHADGQQLACMRQALQQQATTRAQQQQVEQQAEGCAVITVSAAAADASRARRSRGKPQRLVWRRPWRQQHSSGPQRRRLPQRG